MFIRSADIEAIVAAREARERDAQVKGAKLLVKILDTPQSGMSRRYSFDMFGGDEADDDCPDPAAYLVTTSDTRWVWGVRKDLRDIWPCHAPAPVFACSAVYYAPPASPTL